MLSKVLYVVIIFCIYGNCFGVIEYIIIIYGENQFDVLSFIDINFFMDS